MHRLNFTLDQSTVLLLERLAEKLFHGNKSQTVRAALESLAAHSGYDGWVISGYIPMEISNDASCHTCGSEHHSGEVLYRPVFERGESPRALPSIPKQAWLDCPKCVEVSLAFR
jgi:hypothetical protein